MKLSIKNAIYQAIIQNKWLDVFYTNKNNEKTHYNIAVKDIFVSQKKVLCDLFNVFKDNERTIIQDAIISIESINSARVMDHTYYDVPTELLDKVANNKELYQFLDISNFDNNILRYFSDCYKLDSDPFLKEIVMIDGIDIHTLSKNGKYKLDDKQFDELLRKVFKENIYEAEKSNRFLQLAMNKFSIDINDKQYVVAYRTLSVNFKDKTLKISDHSSINKSFLINGKKVSLGMYFDLDPEEFCNKYDENEKEYIEAISDNFKYGEKVNTRPNIFFLSREVPNGVDEAFEAIHNMDLDNKLSIPLKAFFGRNKNRSGTNKDVNIVVFDKNKVNIDQLRVVYNSMVNHVTYVKGPPGTGKTETIFNVILSAYANDKTVLVCSNNNHPVNDIYKKMNNSLTFNNGYDNIEKFFPIIRLGNNQEMLETLNYLRKVLDFARKISKIPAKEEYTEQSKNKSMYGYSQLKRLLNEYEAELELREKIETLEKIKKLNNVDQIYHKLNDIIYDQKAKYQKLNRIQNGDLLKFTISASEDKDFQNYIYFSSILKFKKLLNETYKELREIISLGDNEEAVKQLNKYLRDDLNLRRILAIFPIVICTNLSCEKLGSPRQQFDLVIMDESGQCNIASSLIPIVRGTNLLLVGDTNQLQPVTVLENGINDNLKDKYNIKDEYDYIKNSILSTMLRKDNNSKNILLRYHYRCGKKIAGFVNQRFYDKQLMLENQNEGQLVYYNVKNFTGSNRNSYHEEAKQIVKVIQDLKLNDVGVITPFVNQASLINKYLKENNIENVKAGTIHTLQGSEKSAIIMSAALSLKTSQKTMDWIKNNHELINVGVTRAKEKFIFIGDKQAIDLLSKNEKNDIKVLSDYIHEKGEIVVPKSETTIMYDFSNNSKNEKDFFDTIQPYFNRRGTKYRIERNVPVLEAIKNVLPYDLKFIGKKEFDVIVQVTEGVLNRRYKTVVAFEIDGGEHIGNKQTVAYDKVKREICQKYGIKLIKIANSAVKDYEYILSIFECAVKDISNIDEVYTQMSLFDEN